MTITNICHLYMGTTHNSFFYLQHFSVICCNVFKLAFVLGPPPPFPLSTPPLPLIHFLAPVYSLPFHMYSVALLLLISLPPFNALLSSFTYISPGSTSERKYAKLLVCLISCSK